MRTEKGEELVPGRWSKPPRHLAAGLSAAVMLNGNTDAAERLALALRIAEAEFYLREVERVCGADGCLDAHCRVADSLRRSLDSDRIYLAKLEASASLELAS
jgi:hypothetical protein